MSEVGHNSSPQSCGPDCACNAKRTLSPRTRLILFSIIMIAAAGAFGASLLKKSHSADTTRPPTYAAAIAANAALPASGPTSPSANRSATAKTFSIAPLASLASLDTLARETDGVFIVLVNSDAEMTRPLRQEIAAAAATIDSRGMRMAAYQLSAASTDFAALKTQMQLPGVLVAAKGKGMRSVPAGDLTQTKLLQAWLGAMQPSGCCAGGGNKQCK